MAANTKRVQTQTAAVATGAGTDIDVSGYDSLAIQVTGITTATVSFQGTIDGSNWYAVPFYNSAGSVVSSATADGIFVSGEPFTGYLRLRTNITAWTSGTINVYVVAVE